MKPDKTDEHFMRLAIEEAEIGLKEGNLPFGAVVVKNGKILAKGHAVVDTNSDPTAHGEIQAIRKAAKKLKTYQLEGCTLYTTCEPCMMCTSAIFWSLIPRVVIGATRKDAPEFFDQAKFSFSTLKNQAKHKLEPTFGVLREECSQLYSNLSL